MSSTNFSDHFINVNRIRLHYIDYESDGLPLLFLHGLTANAHAFDGLANKGLSPQYRIICPDMRGRGLSDHPAFHYSFEDHTWDILGLLDHLNIEKITLCGHSFGGLLSFYIAACYPERVEKLVILDAAAEMNPNAPDMLAFAFGRFNVSYPSFDDYLNKVKLAPYNTIWDDDMISYYRADVKENPDGSVKPLSNLTDIIEISYNVANISWPHYVERITQPAILLNALDDYTLGEPLLPEEKARQTAAMIKNCKYIPIYGNHQTMLYGKGALQIIKEIKGFIK